MGYSKLYSYGLNIKCYSINNHCFVMDCEKNSINMKDSAEPIMAHIANFVLLWQQFMLNLVEHPIRK